VHPMMAELGVVMSEWRTEKVIDLQRAGILLVEDGKHGEYRPRPDRSIRMADLRAGKAVSRHYRNRRIGDFLKELDLTEGRSTGISKVLKVMKENGSPPPEFETDGDRSYFLIRLPAHPKVESKESARADTKGKTSEKTSEKILTEIRNNRNVTIAELSELVGVTTRSVERNLKKLQESGLLERIGPAKGGYWVVKEES